MSRPPRKPGRWLTTTQAAQLLGKGRWTVWNWCRRGVIPAQYILMVGDHARIDRAFCEACAP